MPDASPIPHAADVALASAALRGLPGAHAELDALLVRAVAAGIARIDRSEPFAALVAQTLRERLLLGEPPRLAGYTGRGSLFGWLRVAAARTALNVRRAEAPHAHDDLSSGLRASQRDPELAVLRRRYAGELEGALRAALQHVAPRERAALCLVVRDGMTLDEVAALYHVGRSTAHRWVASARETLTRETRRALEARMGISEAELESLVRDVGSRVDVSLVRLLGEG